MSTPLFYLGCPYSHNNPAIRAARYEMVTRLTAKLISQNAHVFSPITHSHPMVKWGLYCGWDFWRNYDLRMLTHCDGGLIVYCLPDWEDSVGLTAEIEYCQNVLQRPVKYEHLSVQDLRVFVDLIERFEDEMEFIT